jgi:cyanobactin maturation PatA/PatG family protease
VSGIAALLVSLQRQQGRPNDPYAVRNALLQGASPCKLSDGMDEKRCLAGRLNLSETYTLLMKKGGSQAMSEKETMVSSEPEIAEDVQQDAVVAVTPSADCGCTMQNEVPDAPEQEMSDTLPEPAAVQTSPAVAPSSAAAVTPSSSCGCGVGSSQLVYALGDLDVDYGSEAKRDSYTQAMLGYDNLLAYLDGNAFAAQNLIWTLNLDATPIYAIVPMGAYASEAYDQLRKALASFGEGRIERVGIPGYIGGSIQLMSGQTVPTIIPEVRGMAQWKNADIRGSAIKMLEEDLKEDKASEEETKIRKDKLDVQLENYLNRVYYDYRNLGLTPQERALNFSATNAHQITKVLKSTGQENIVLDQIQVEKSPICRPDSDCHDVKLTFFDPENNQRSRRIYRFTVDVSEAVPVTIGTVRSWIQS